ncbi:MAG: hypothetical protein K2M62_02195 [Muribaculaceae bacterium]|nr:hypothetical protein [Muribaculaceae bacterium]
MKSFNIRLILIVLSILSFAICGYAQTENCDTVFSASSAKALRITSNNENISVVIEKFDNGAENYYYNTGLEETGGHDDNLSYMAQYQDLKDINVVEQDNRVLIISFKGETDVPNVLSFDIPDPDNRFVSSYTGVRNPYQGVNLSLNRKGKHRWDFVSFGLGLGWATPLNAPAGLDVAMGKSLELSWTILAGVKWNYGCHSVSAGLGLDGKWFSLKKGHYFNKEADGRISTQPFSEMQERGASSLKFFSLQVPVLYDLRLGRARRFGFAVGPVVNFNVTGHLQTSYRIGDSDYSVVTRHIGQRPVTVDFLGVVHYSPIALYVRYSPMQMMKKSAGLSFSTLSTGIMLFF